MAHVQAHEHPAITRIVLQRRVLKVDESERFVDQFGEFLGDVVRLVLVARRHAVVVEGHAVDNRHQQEGPVRAAFGDGYAVVVVYGEEDVADVGEVGEGVLFTAN